MVRRLKVIGFKRIALYSSWFPASLVVLEWVAYSRIQPLEWLFIALAWPAVYPLTISTLLLYRVSPFSAGFCAVLCVQATFMPYLWVGVLGFALGTEYWLSPTEFFDVLVGIFRVFAEPAVVSLLPWIVLGCSTWFRRWRRNRLRNHTE